MCDLYRICMRKTVVRCAVGTTESFKVKVGLHQGSELSPFLFAVIMDRLTDEVRRKSPWTMLFADDIVICKETRKEVERRLECWRYALERRGIKVKYLGSTVQESDSCKKDVKTTVQAGWNGWRKVSRVTCDRRLPARVK